MKHLFLSILLSFGQTSTTSQARVQSTLVRAFEVASTLRLELDQCEERLELAQESRESAERLLKALRPVETSTPTRALPTWSYLVWGGILLLGGIGAGLGVSRALK